MPVTAKDVAASLGLSQPTVSRALSAAHQHQIAPETRRRVQEAARRMGYRPNAVARSLRRRRTHIVGFYTSYGSLYSDNPFLAAIIGGLQRGGDAHRLDLLLHGLYRGWSTDDIYGELLDGRIDGLFLHADPGDPLVARLAASDLPVVALVDALPGLPSAVCDDRGGMAQAVEYLWARGHRHVAFLAPERPPPSVLRRGDTLRECLARRGADAPPSVVAPLTGEGPLLSSVLSLSPRPTAVCCWNDRAAYMLLRECEEQGVRVPEDLAVVGFDGLPSMTPPARHLVTVAAPWGEVARAAVDALADRMGGSGGADEVCLPVALVSGDTA